MHKEASVIVIINFLFYYHYKKILDMFNLWAENMGAQKV